MNIQETLTKENFWDEMMSKYPNATKRFCDWIDEYKKAVGWKELFGEVVRPDYTFSAPKFHDLPHAMQLGLWVEFLRQRGGCNWEIENFFEFDLREDIEGMFKEILEPDAVDELA